MGRISKLLGLFGIVLASQGLARQAALTMDGFPGSIHTPSALVPQAGTVALSLSRFEPYSGLSLTVQPFEWLTAGMRYTSISGREYGPGIDQSYKDKGFDLVFRLREEGRVAPAVAVGLIDIGGTALFGSEYLVASKRIQQFEISAGLGWGRLGSAGDIRNPLRSLSSRFDDRPLFSEQEQEAGRQLEGGEFTFGHLFSGEGAGLFGSVQWASPTDRWRLMVEYESNAYDSRPGADPLSDAEPSTRAIVANSRWNVGLKFRLIPGADLSLAYIRGNALAGGFTFSSAWGDGERRRKADDYPVWLPAVPEHLRSNEESEPVSDLDRVTKFSRDMWRQGLYVSEVNTGESHVTVWFSSSFSKRIDENAVAAGRLAERAFGDEFQQFEFVQTQGGLIVSALMVDRADLDLQARSLDPLEDWAARVPGSGASSLPSENANFTSISTTPAWSYGINPALRSNIGGAGGFFLSDFQIRPFLTYQATASTSITSTLAWSAFGNLENAEANEDGSLPRVRSDIELYQRLGPAIYLQELEINTMWQLAENVYGRVSAGVFEEMYAGVGGEVLWRPFGKRYALGLDLARVRQRDFDQWFGFRDYQATTGHVTLYWDTPWAGIRTRISAGRYLAGDVGATLRLSRRFRNGFEAGVFATKTNVSAEEFGEGSFDKGVFLSFPVGAANSRLRGGDVDFQFRFLSRDGGQMVDHGRNLYPLVYVDWEDRTP